MKQVLVLGAGLVARPLVRYLLEKPDISVRVASRTLSKAERIVASHPRGEAQQLDVTDLSALEALIPASDLVVSLLPYTFHVKVAELCIRHRRPMVTTSYVSEPMQLLDEAARKADIIILNEIGLDPGIDHMSAMTVIRRVQSSGGRVKSFLSYCGALPAPEANTNPLGYKFSWSPKGVLLAAKSSAKYLKDGREVVVPVQELFHNCSAVQVEELGEFEAYPNRDSLPYVHKYGIDTTETILRGTLRYPGWCQTWKSIGELGLLEEKEIDLEGLTYGGLLGKITSGEGNSRKDLARWLKVPQESEVIRRLEWLGLLSDDPLPLKKGSLLDMLLARLSEKLQYGKGERDMVILRHEFVGEWEKKEELISSTLIAYGEPEGDSAVSKTVGLPAAIGSRLILEGEIDLKGVQIPVNPVIYEPVLKELENQGVELKERSQVVPAT